MTTLNLSSRIAYIPNSTVDLAYNLQSQNQGQWTGTKKVPEEYLTENFATTRYHVMF